MAQPANAAVDRDTFTTPELHRAFSRSIFVSAVRCLLTYVVFPFLLPAAGWGAGVGPAIGIPLSLLGIVFNAISIRRFQRTGHKNRWFFSAINVAVIVLLAILVVDDLGELVG